jgi:hypothetical protein
MRVLKAIAFEIGLFVIGVILGNVLYRVALDVFRPASMDRSSDAAQGAGILLGFLLVVVHLVIRAVRRRKEPS